MTSHTKHLFVSISDHLVRMRKSAIYCRLTNFISMSLKFMHQVIIFAAIGVDLISGAWSFFATSNAADWRFEVLGVASIFVALLLVRYEFYFLKKTKRLILG